MKHLIVLSVLVAFGTTAGASPAQSQQQDSQASLRNEAKISLQQAEKTAIAKEHGKIKSHELEKEHGRLIYSFDIQTPRGIREVNIDAVKGTVVEDSAESQAAEAVEKLQEQKEQKNAPESKGDSANRVPAPLVNTGEYAENIYDAAQGANWTQAKHKLSSLQDAIRSLPSRVSTSQKQEIESASQKLSQSISTQNRIPTLKEANEITRLAAEASARFRSTPPVEVSLLDYYGRELQIGAETNDLPSLHRTATGMQQAWSQIRSEVERRSVPAASRFNELISKISSAQSASQYARLAKAELDQVDTLEKVFETSATTAQR